MMHTTHDLTVFFGTSVQQPVGLKNLIQEQFVDCCIPHTLVLTVVLAPEVTVMLHDDLGLHETCTIKEMRHTLIFVLGASSRLIYHAKAGMQAGVTQSADDAIIEKDLTVRLNGVGAHAELNCSCYGLGNRIYRFTTRQEHCVEQTSSTVSIKGVLDQAACVISKNAITISPQAQHCHAQQSTKNILLSSNAHALAIPQLEIQADDVVCKHGAAISSLSDEHLFYLQSRGIDDQQTRQILVQAFLD